jgi:hypothetical protein
LDAWTIQPEATDASACRVTITSTKDPNITFAFDLPRTSAASVITELESHAAWIAERCQSRSAILELSDDQLAGRIRSIHSKLSGLYRPEDLQERLALWDEEIPMREELTRRHPVVVPPQLRNGGLSRHHHFVATGGQSRLSSDDMSFMARTVLNMQRAKTPAACDAADRKLTSNARRIWLSLQPEYDGEFDPEEMRTDIENARGDRTYAECLGLLSTTTSSAKNR